MDAYLDIETTGLSPVIHRITVVGLSVGSSDEVLQWIGNDINAMQLHEALKQCKTLYTYNGSKFDIPFLKYHLGAEILANIHHYDLLFDCWRSNFYGGLKAVEKRLGISRRLKNINGLEAVKLWRRYELFHDMEALQLLLEYNKEDVINLKILKKRLAGYP